METLPEKLEGAELSITFSRKVWDISYMNNNGVWLREVAPCKECGHPKPPVRMTITGKTLEGTTKRMFELINHEQFGK
jgi:hypothetical protein